jgi:putative chitinase
MSSTHNQTITAGILREIMPTIGTRADVHAQHLDAAMREFGIVTLNSQSAFLANVLHETGGLARFVENLNYRPEALIATFNDRVQRFTREAAEKYGRTERHAADQPMIANIAYANRFGNGDVASGDGWKYRGRGAGQLTFRDNYAGCGKALKLNLLAHPELIEQPSGAARSFGWFWLAHGLNALAGGGDIVAVSKRVNGGTNGLAERVELFRRAKRVLE